jgi:ABC-2 type transport system permease protein
MNDLRVFFSCGLTSFRALFGWVNPYVFVPILVVYPIAQILFFSYLGRSAGVESDSFFLIGNVFCAAAVAAMFGMGQAIGGERRFQTLPVLMASPVNRLVMYSGRAVPTVVLGFFVAMIAFVCGAAILGVHVGESEAFVLVLALLASCFTCAGLGLCIGSLGLRGRSVGLFADVMAGGLLIVSGANVPLEKLPDAVQSFASIVPLTHGIEAARSVAAGARLSEVGGLLGKEVGIGAVYMAVGLVLVVFFEREGRRTGAFDRF